MGFNIYFVVKRLSIEESYLTISPLLFPGYFIYFTTTVFATCYGWHCWSGACGFVLMGMLYLTMSVYAANIYVSKVSLLKLDCLPFVLTNEILLQRPPKLCFWQHFYSCYHFGMSQYHSGVFVCNHKWHDNFWNFLVWSTKFEICTKYCDQDILNSI